MKIVYATDNYWPHASGMAVSIDSFKKQLEILNHEVHVFCAIYTGHENIDREMNNKNIHRFPGYPMLFSEGGNPEDWLVYPWSRKKIYAELDKVKPDIIHTQTEFPMARFCYDYAAKNNIPLVSTAHSYFEEYIKVYYPYIPHFLSRIYTRYKELKTFNRSQIIIVPSPQMADVLKSYRAKRPIFIIPTGIDEDEFKGTDKDIEKKNSKFYKQHPVLKNKKILFYVGRIGAEKNVLFLLDVLEEVLKKNPDTMLVLAGGGPKFEEFKQLSIEKNLDKYIILLGYVERALIKYWYALADILVFPSKTETQGLVSIESMYCGTPVVAIGAMGTKFVMNGDNGGFMVNDDLKDFSEKVNLLLEDKKLYAKKSAEAKKYSKNWTSKKSANELLKLYEDVLAGKFSK
jgi:glycosyltransferase involved in cell wall biosynthesis